MKSSKWNVEMNRRYAAPGEVLYVLQGKDIGLKKYGSSKREQHLLHYHLLLEIGVCRDGRGQLYFNERQLDYGPGMVSFIPPHFPHTTFSEPGTLSFWEYIFIDIDKVLDHLFPSDVLSRQQMYEAICSKASFWKTAEVPGLVSLITLIFEETGDKGAHDHDLILSLSSSLLLLLARINKTSASDNENTSVSSSVVSEGDFQPVSAAGLFNNYEQIRPGLKMIRDNYADHIYIADLARACSLSESHFRKLFRDIVGMSPAMYINDYRIYMACSLLEKTKLSMTEIAINAAMTHRRHLSGISARSRPCPRQNGVRSIMTILSGRSHHRQNHQLYNRIC